MEANSLFPRKPHVSKTGPHSSLSAYIRKPRKTPVLLTVPPPPLVKAQEEQPVPALCNSWPPTFRTLLKSTHNLESAHRNI